MPVTMAPDVWLALLLAVVPTVVMVATTWWVLKPRPEPNKASRTPPEWSPTRW